MSRQELADACNPELAQAASPTTWSLSGPSRFAARYSGEREVGFDVQYTIIHAALLQFCNVPPAGDKPAGLDRGIARVELGRCAV